MFDQIQEDVRTHSDFYIQTLFCRHEISPKTDICIVIPVRNEEKYLAKSLAAFAFQKDISNKACDPETFEILILANNCTDNSVEEIKKFQENNPKLQIYFEDIQLPLERANIGFVRRLLMEIASKRLFKKSQSIIMTTDADTVVESDWIYQNSTSIKNGADAVGGRILLYEDELQNLDSCTRINHLKDEKYQLLIAELEALVMQEEHDCAPRHHQHFNGSFAISNGCYKKAGGVPEVAFLEDCAFFERLQLVDAKIRHSHDVKVRTSARFMGRTEVGLSFQLNEWKNLASLGKTLRVESPDVTYNKFLTKRKLKTLWEKRNNENFNSLTFLQINFPKFQNRNEVNYKLHENEFFGTFYTQVRFYFEENQSEEKVEIERAIDILEDLISECYSKDFSQTSSL